MLGSRLSLFLGATLMVAVLATGCGDDDRPITTVDSGMGDGGTGDGGSTDGGGTDAGAGEDGGGTDAGPGDGGGGGDAGTDAGPDMACGNGAVEGTEECDDSGESATCDDDCTAAMCGDSLVNATAGETCDDSGESATCDDDCTAAMCGDGLVNATAGETCDDSGESATCDGDCTAAMCGDGAVNATAGETCDDGGTTTGDGCDAACAPESGYTCTGEPSVCATVCGDGIVTGAEECDDGGTAAGDGCSAACTTEPDWVCSGMPSVCSRIPTAAGDLVITEIMKDPVAVTDAAGEWFEIHNPTGDAVELMGLEIADDGTDSHVIASSVIVPAGGYAVLGRNAETSSNGGITLDYEYGGFFLAQAGDEVVLIQGTTEIDRVAYDDTAFPDTAGAALSLAIGSTDSVANDAGTAWCDAAFPYGGGDLGTPGLANPSCSPVSTSPGLIPDDDPAGITRTAVMDAAGCTITSVDVDIEITHPFRGDLVVDLTSPAGTTVRLHDRTGGTADDLIGNYPATLTEDGPGSLADFVGEIADGTWTLGVSDEAPVDVGNLRTWAVNVTCEVASGETPGTAIPDNDSTGITDTTTIATPVGCTVAGVRVPIEITHPWRGDLFIRLTSPAGTAVTLKNTNAIDSADDVSGEYPTTLTPAESLDAFLGEDPDGAWTLFVSDNSVLDTGTLDSWGVAVDCGRVAADDTAAPLPIPDDDPAGIDSTRLVDGACTIAGLNVDVAITHTYRGDLIVELTSPLGTVVRLKTTDSLDSADDVVGNYPYTLAPFESLGAFVGEDANGIWTLDVSDNAALDLGTLDSWQLNLDCS